MINIHLESSRSLKTARDKLEVDDSDFGETTIEKSQWKQVCSKKVTGNTIPLKKIDHFVNFDFLNIFGYNNETLLSVPHSILLAFPKTVSKIQLSNCESLVSRKDCQQKVDPCQQNWAFSGRFYINLIIVSLEILLCPIFRRHTYTKCIHMYSFPDKRNPCIFQRNDSTRYAQSWLDWVILSVPANLSCFLFSLALPKFL